jgi:mRNA deadenylase 3'-5' endonuclease subunit Ccr4
MEMFSLPPIISKDIAFVNRHFNPYTLPENSVYMDRKKRKRGDENTFRKEDQNEEKVGHIDVLYTGKSKSYRGKGEKNEEAIIEGTEFKKFVYFAAGPGPVLWDYLGSI